MDVVKGGMHMPSMIGIPGLIIILVVALLLFGPSKLPELGRAFGRTLHEFKRGAKNLMDEEEESTAKRKEVQGTEEQEIRRLPE